MKKNIFCLICFFILGIFLVSCREEESIIEETPPTTEQTIEKFIVTETQAGKIKTILEAESAIIEDNEKKAYLTLPRIKFYEDGKYTSILVAESGEIDLETNDVKALGKCTVDTVKNEYLQTRDIAYSASKKLISSNNNIKITRGKEVIYGSGFSSDINLENITVKNQRVIIEK